MVGAANGIYQDVTNYSSAAIVGENLDTSAASGTRYGSGVFGYSTVPNGSGVFGRATSGSVTNGVFGKSSSSGASGVYAENDAAGYGVYGYAHSTGNSGGTGVFGTTNNGSSGTGGIGVEGTAVGSNAAGVWASATGSSASGVYSQCSGTGCWAAYFSGNVNVTGTLTCGSGCSSDRALKKNIESLSSADALAKMLALRGVTYEWIDGDAGPDAGETPTHPAGRQMGVIAQDVREVMPHWVHKNEKGTLSVQPDQRELLGLSVEAFRAQQEQIDMLKLRVKALESGHPMSTAGFGAMPAALVMCCLAIIALATSNLRSMRRRA